MKHDVTMDAESAVTPLRVKGHVGLPGAHQKPRRGRIPSQYLQKEQAPLQGCGRIHFCGLQPPLCGAFLSLCSDLVPSQRVKGSLQYTMGLRPLRCAFPSLMILSVVIRSQAANHPST